MLLTSLICTALALHVHRQSRNNRRCYVAQPDGSRGCILINEGGR